MEYDSLDVKNSLYEIAEIIDAEVDRISAFFTGETYESTLFKEPVNVNSDVEEKDFARIPEGKGLYVFRVTTDFQDSEFKSFKSDDCSTRTTKLRKGVECSELRKGCILYVGSTKSMGIRARLKEHLIKAGNGVYSLRLYEKKGVKKKTEVICFELNSFEKADYYVKSLLSCIEEKLQIKMKPVAGRYRG